MGTDSTSPSASGDLVIAVTAAVRTGGWEAAAALVEQHWDRLATKDPAQLLAAVKTLPGEAFLRNPGLLAAANYLTHVTVGGTPERIHLAMHHGSAVEGDDLLPRLIVLTNESAAARVRDDPEEAARVAREALQLLEAAPAQVVAPIGKSVVHLRMQWARSFDAADSQSARVAYEETYELALATDQPHVARRAAGHAAWLHAERGRTRLAEQWVQRARKTGVIEDRYDAALHLTEALLFADRDDFPGAVAALERADAGGLGEYWAADLWLRSFLARNVADAAIVESRVAAAIQKHPRAVNSAGLSGRFLRGARVRVVALRGRLVDDVDDLIDLSSSDRSIAAATAHLAGRDHDALRLVAPVAEDSSNPRLQASALLVQASAALTLRYTETAIHAFLRADALIQHERMHTTYECIEPDALTKLIELSGSDTQHATRVTSFRRDLPELTKRENDILSLLATDLSAGEIASALFISPNTLKTMTRRVYRKLNVSSRQAAVDYAHRVGFINTGTGS
ncbi:LuxR C-terminal-related transcriptional regulator [Curtobacterium flaccumfaciens]|uniref:helix-turn-helix transcriptional regulator n=1 Tax=Curtobacterium flaccumfaciens TaxID=2035 RepID=UPI003990F70E